MSGEEQSAEECAWGRSEGRRAGCRGARGGEDIGRLRKEVFAVKNLIYPLLCVIMGLFLDEKHTRKR